MNPGIIHWFSEDQESLVGYVKARRFPGSRSRMWIAAGGPVCAAEKFDGVVRSFESAAMDDKCRVCWFGADTRLRETIGEHHAYSEIVLGAQPVWNPAAWPHILDGKASLRSQLNRARNKGVEVAQWSHEEAEGNPQLQRCLDEWLQTRGLPPLHFLVEPQTLGNLKDRRIFVASKSGFPLGFLLLTPIPARNGWLVEQIIQGHEAPNGTAALLVNAAMSSAAMHGSTYVTLGLSPLSTRAVQPTPNPLWLRWLIGWLRAHGKRFYNFKGLESFKAKFVPERWDPIVAISNLPGHSFGTLYAIADAFGGDRSPERLIGRALRDAIVDEVRNIRRRFF
jgi:phosphatidylglycerol lysyltransferase